MTTVEPAPLPAPAPPAEPTSDVSIRFDGVGKRFDDSWVLRDVDMQIREGTVFGMIGPSGCGKTTTVRLALGDHRPDAGEVRVQGQDPCARSLQDRTQVGYLPQHPVLFDDLTLAQNLRFHASLVGLPRRRHAQLGDLLELVDLAGHESKRVREASGGMKRRLALAATLVHEPPILMLDEPTAGVDPILRTRLWDEFRRLADHRTTLVVTTQFVEEAAYCDEVAVLAGGTTVAVGPPSRLVAEAYGGRRVDLEFDGIVSAAELASLEEIDVVVEARASARDGARLVVDDSAPDSPSGADLVDLLARRLSDAGSDRRIVSSSAVTVDWNDVFARIVGRHTGAESDGDRERGPDREGDGDDR